MQGKIIKGIAGFYYVDVVESGIFECKAKGVFRKQGRKPLVGDLVDIEVLDESKKTGNIAEIAPRKNELIRPPVANIDVGMAVMAFSSPAPNLNTLDMFLLMTERRNINAAICFNKCDLATDEEIRSIKERYKASGYPVFFISVREKRGIQELKEFLRNKITAFSGPSGVGKSSLSNELLQRSKMETGNLSDKLKRGKNTTRHVELLAMPGGGYIMDTPGFTSLEPEEFEAETLRYYYPEIYEYEGMCRFTGCMHDKEPDCEVHRAVNEGKIPKGRYESYINLYHTLKEKKRR